MLKQVALKAAVIKTLMDFLKREEADTRADLFAMMLEAHKQYGAKSFDVHVGDVKVASLPMTFDKPGPVIDTVRFDAWCKTAHPEAFVQPPTPEPYIPATWREEFVSRLMRSHDGAFVTSDGEEVPGVSWREATPKTYSTRFEKGGAEVIAQAWASGELGELMPGMAPSLPAHEEG